jgi:hypothetical protein
MELEFPSIVGQSQRPNTSERANPFNGIRFHRDLYRAFKAAELEAIHTSRFSDIMYGSVELGSLVDSDRGKIFLTYWFSNENLHLILNNLSTLKDKT